MSFEHVEERDIPREPRPRTGESYITGKNNQLIMFGRDRPSTIDSGYGSEPGAGTIHMVVGRKERDPDFRSDSAFVYMSMRTDIDKNLGLDKMVDGGGHALPARTGSGLIIKSDNIRIVRRDTGDVRISSEDGSNFINFDKSSCEIKIGASWLKIEDGTITVQSGVIKLGPGADKNRVVLGDSFMNDIFNKHTHQSPVGPTSQPLLPMTPAQLSEKSWVE